MRKIIVFVMFFSILLLSACESITYSQIELPSDLKAYAADYQFRVLEIESSATLSIKDEDGIDRNVEANVGKHFIVLSIEIKRLEVVSSSGDYQLEKADFNLKNHVGLGIGKSWAAVEDYSWIGLSFEPNETKTIIVAFLIDSDITITNTKLVLDFDLFATATGVDLELNTRN